MSQPSGSESSGGGKDNDGLTYIPFTLHRDGNTSLRHLYLEMPSGMEDISKSSACPKVFLLVNDKDKSQKDCLKMMHNLIHENVLGVKFWEEVQDEPYIRVYVEPYTAFVSELLKKAEFAVNPATHSVPSRDFRKMVWAAINALDYIRESGNYHGNFSWRTTLYLEANGNIVVKLAYFERKSLRLVQRNMILKIMISFGMRKGQRCSLPMRYPRFLRMKQLRIDLGRFQLVQRSHGKQNGHLIHYLTQF
ncbi:hypothetical protein ACQJBY_030343 [Aegilops geniculata]